LQDKKSGNTRSGFKQVIGEHELIGVYFFSLCAAKIKLKEFFFTDSAG